MIRPRPVLVLLATLALAGAACGGDAGGPADADAAGDGAGDAAGGGDAGPDAPLSVEPAQGLCVPNAEAFPVRPTPSAATLPPLRVEGRSVVDDQGNAVALRGVNFGSWLNVEPWIIGVQVLELELDEAVLELEAKMKEHGCEATMAPALEAGLQAYLFEGLTYPEIIELVRETAYANVVPGEEAGLDAFWAWFDTIPFLHSEQDLWWRLADRFGWDEAQALREVFRDHYVTELDFQRAHEMGLNTIRLPFWWDLLESDDAAGAAFRPGGWARLHQALEWARTWQLYVILDMHGAPGGQSREPHTGTSYGNKLWSHPECVDKTARLWQALAAWADGDPHVAALDLLNEPTTAPSKEEHEAVLDRLYDAIREVNADTIVMYEDGYLPRKDLPSPKAMGWENYMFSVHMYPRADSLETVVEGHIQGVLNFKDYWEAQADCPILVGELAVADETPFAVEASARVFEAFNQMGLHWTTWTWKFWKPESLWGGLPPRGRGHAAGRGHPELRGARRRLPRHGLRGLRAARALPAGVRRPRRRPRGPDDPHRAGGAGAPPRRADAVAAGPPRC